MKKLLVLGLVVGALVGAGLIAYAAYNIDGSSPAQGFTSGTAANLAVDPEEWDLNGILPGQTRSMDVLITNPNSGQATVTGLTATFNDGGVCAFTVTNVSSYSYAIGGGASVWDAVSVTMGNAQPQCEGNSALTVTATATGWLP